MVKKVINLIIFVPLAIVLIVLCVANRQWVTLALNPFRPEDSYLSLGAPFFVFLLVTFLLGAIVGTAATWFAQGKHRKRARVEARSAVKWRSEAQEQKQRAEQAAVVPSLNQLPSR